MKPFLFASAAYLSAVFLNVLTSVLIKYLHINSDLNLNQIIAIRVILAMFMLTPFMAGKLKNINKKHIKLIILTGFLSYLDIYLWHYGVSIVPINNAVVVSFLVPILITFFACVILKEPLYLGSIIALIIAFCAINLIYQITPNVSSFGYFVLIADFTAGALGFVLTKKLTSFYNPLLIVYLKICVVLPIAFILIGSIPVFTVYSFIFVFICSIIYILERYLFTLAYKLHDMGPLQPLRFFNILFSFILSYLILKETINVWQIIVAFMIIFANLINMFYKTKIIKI
jgi:drug/metabolite transporter (DMT)-like permease